MPFAARSADPRTFALGFTDFPHANSSEGVLSALQVIAAEGDLAVVHFDGGVPWLEALAGDPYPAPVQQEIDFEAASVPAGHRVFLAITPIAFSRDRLAPVWGGTAPPPGWEEHAFDHPDVVAAYSAHALRMIAAFEPDAFAYAIEANLLYELDPASWAGFVSLAHQVYAAVRAFHPALPIFVTLQAESFHRQRADQPAAIGQLLGVSDWIALSTYPFFEQEDPLEVPADHLAALANLAPGKPFAIAETSWPAEDVTLPFPFFRAENPERQRQWLERILAEADGRDTRLIGWFFTRDFDAFWESDLRFDPAAELIRAWKDSGLLAGDGTPRPALALWREAKSRRLVPEPHAAGAGCVALASLAAIRRLRSRNGGEWGDHGPIHA